MSIQRDKEGRFNQWAVPVEDYEIAYAQRNAQCITRPAIQARYCIAFGKACGSYDPAPARAWWEAQQRSVKSGAA